MKDFSKTPKQALNLAGSNEVQFQFSENPDEKPKASMEGYSGGIIENHWWWGNLVIDLAGMSFPKAKYPALRDHDTDKIIGFFKKPDVSENKLTIDNIEIVDTEHADEFVKLSKQGVPFEASIYAQPSEIQRLGEDEYADVNGFKFKGPGTIWRKSKFKECSVCVFGYDSKTSSVAMNEDAETLDLSSTIVHAGQKPTSSEEPIMTLKELQEKDPEGYKKLTEEIAASVTNQFSADVAAKDAEIAELKKEKEAFGEAKKTTEEKLNDLNKKFELLHEKTLASAAHSILAAKLSESGLNDRVKEKIIKFTDYSKFVKEDNLDVTAFSAAVDAEIADMKSMFGEHNPVQGGAGAPTKQLGSTTEQFTEEDAEVLAKSMALAAGQIIA